MEKHINNALGKNNISESICDDAIEELVNSYQELNEKCDKVILKIKERKKKQKS